MQIGVIAPNQALRAGLRALLGAGGGYPPAAWQAATGAAAHAAFQVVYEAASAAEFIQDAPPVDLLVVVADSLDQSDIKRFLPEDESRLAMLLLCDDPRQALALRELPLSGWGVLPLDTSAEELQAALWAIQEGLVVGTQRLLAPALAQPQLVVRQEAQSLEEALTERENQVLQLLAHGLANKQIALALRISEHTVKFHISSIYTKLGATNRTEAVRLGMQRGLVVL
jgi:DNA-binding NarL/FixJ family response regulator